MQVRCSNVIDTAAAEAADGTTIKPVLDNLN
jgi:hypothetical protein